MFSVEIKINGSMIRHIYGHNKGYKQDGSFDTCDYEGAVYNVEDSKLIPYKITHKRSDGISKLVADILHQTDEN